MNNEDIEKIKKEFDDMFVSKRVSRGDLLDHLNRYANPDSIKCFLILIVEEATTRAKKDVLTKLYTRGLSYESEALSKTRKDKFLILDDLVVDIRHEIENLSQQTAPTTSEEVKHD